MTMPGLPRVPAANNIRLNKKRYIEGYFKFIFLYLAASSDPPVALPLL